MFVCLFAHFCILRAWSYQLAALTRDIGNPENLKDAKCLCDLCLSNLCRFPTVLQKLVSKRFIQQYKVLVTVVDSLYLDSKIQHVNPSLK